MLIATFDDDQEELIEIFDTGLFFFFCLLILFLLFKYSLHYFAFLESSIAEGKSVNYVTKQFFRDFINTFALLLRFFILLFRLNVYDTLDDFYDSYYIYSGDFDDDEHFFDMFFSFYPLFFLISIIMTTATFPLKTKTSLWLIYFVYIFTVERNFLPLFYLF